MTATPNPAAPIVVLDTNVCLDLFVFGDRRCTALHEAVRSREIDAVTDDTCRGEWERVLHYPVLRLDELARAAARARFDALVRPVLHDAQTTAPQHLLRCRDPHDQKFLDLAAHAGATWLLSRDDHLLSLAKRARREGLFAILTPEAWLAARTAARP